MDGLIAAKGYSLATVQLFLVPLDREIISIPTFLYSTPHFPFIYLPGGLATQWMTPLAGITRSRSFPGSGSRSSKWWKNYIRGWNFSLHFPTICCHCQRSCWLRCMLGGLARRWLTPLAGRYLFIREWYNIISHATELKMRRKAHGKIQVVSTDVGLPQLQDIFPGNFQWKCEGRTAVTFLSFSADYKQGGTPGQWHRTSASQAEGPSWKTFDGMSPSQSVFWLGSGTEAALVEDLRRDNKRGGV